VKLAFSVDRQTLERLIRENDNKYADISKALIALEIVGFDDGTAWSSGYQFYFDQKSNRWIPTEQSGQVHAQNLFQTVSFKGLVATCTRPTITTDNCCAEGCNVSLSESSGDPGAYTEVDKSRKCTGTCSNCVIFYTGVQPGCP
jgi:hypothetical protein